MIFLNIRSAVLKSPSFGNTGIPGVKCEPLFLRCGIVVEHVSRDFLEPVDIFEFHRCGVDVPLCHGKTDEPVRFHDLALLVIFIRRSWKARDKNQVRAFAL